MGNKCSQCCACSCCKNQKHGVISSASSVYRRRSRDDIPIGNNDRFRITQTSKAVQLAIEHVQKDDTGHYTLYARTKSGEVLRKDVELIVEDRSVGDDPPVFLRRLGDLSVKVGTRTRLLVEIRSSTEVKVTWYRNDRRVCENDRIRYVHEGTFFCLEVAPVILEDGGQWMCMAENLGGRNSCIALLNVLVPKAYKAPEFIEELRAVLTEQGTVSLECKVIGIPTPVLRWFKDSKEIKAGDVFALTANPDDPTSLGTYTCEAVNCMGRAYSSSKVHVVGRGSREGSLKPADSVQYSAPPPIFTDELKDVKVKIGETIILGCKVVVPPWPKTVSWYNKEGRVDSSEKYRMIEDGLGVYMLEIKPSECCDEGEWKCVVTNNEGSVGISTCIVDMEIPKNYRKPRFMESLKAVLTEEGLVSFECKVVGFPTPILKWFKDGQELKPGDVYQLTGTNSLGTYCCVARNCMGESSSVAVLTVEDVQNQLNDEERSFLIQRNQPPKFEIGLKSQEARINEDFEFMVKVKANPDALLTWFRDELPIETNDKYNIKKSEDGVCTLSIQRAEFVDQAEWKCIASNDFGTSVTSCFLKLQIPRHYKKPRFLECLRAVLTEEGAVNLECKVIGVPQPVLKWYKDGVELKPGDIHRIISGQDGTCCLGTYTCEARNCMGIVASSASLLGFEDANRNQNQEGFAEELQRNLSLSTIQEERTSQLYDTPAGDITIEEKGDVSFSFDGKEVSVSLYETPDLTEEEALQIVEMYADQISEHVTEHNVVELPPLRFVKETSQSGNLLMEAVVIDIAPEYFSHEEDMRTEAGMDDISINEITVHQLSSHRDSLPFGEELEIDDQGQMSSRGKKRQKSTNGQDEFYSFSHSKPTDGGRLADDDDTESDLQTFASVQESLNLSSHHTASLKDAEGTPGVANICKDSPEDGSLAEPVVPKRKKFKKGPDSDSSCTQEGLAVLQDISGEAGDGLKLSRSLEPIRDDRLIRRNLEALVPFVKSLSTIEKNLLAIKGEVVCQSGMMMSANSAENSIGIITNIIDPIRQLQSKMKVYSGEIPLEHLFETLEEDVKSLHRNLQVIEKCVEMDEGGRTLIQRTSVCIIDSCGDKLVNALEHVKQITSLFSEVRLKNELGFIIEDIQQGIQITQDTIKSQMLIQEASALETTQHFTETIAKLQTGTTKMPFEEINFRDLPPEAHAVKIIYDPVVKLQLAIESCGRAAPSETQQSLQHVSRDMISNLSESIDYLEAEVLKLEKSALRQAGRDSLEQKINIAILDIVTPPLFELRRGLERIIQTESTGTKDGSNKATFDYLTLPLQEIQCGLAQLTQDVQTGQFSPDQGAEQTADSQRLTQSIAQATINFRSNVESLAPRIDEHLHESLITLVDDVSKVVGEILNNPLDKYSLAILENLKSPIDDLNYCLRQTEERSSSGSLRYFVEPLRNLFERASICEDILVLTGQNSNDYKVQSLKSVQKSVRNLERDIELLEAEMLHQEILAQSNYAEELEEPPPPSTEALALPDFQRNINRIAITLEELQTCIAGIQENIVQQPLLAESLLSKLDKAQSCLSKMKNIAVLSTSREDEVVDNVDLLQNVSRPIRNAVESLQILTQPKETARRDNTSVLKSISESLREIKQCVDSNKDVSKLMAPLSELESCLEEVVNKIAPNSEDVSTMEDVSAIASSAAESLPPVEESSKQRVNVLLKSLKHSLAEVLQSEVVESVASMLPMSHTRSFANAIEKMQSLQEKVAVVEVTSPEEEVASISSLQNIASIQTLAERLNEINSCILQIQQEVAVEQTVDQLKTNEFQVIAAIATPLVQMQHSIDIVQNMIMEATEKLPSQQVASEKLKIIQELQPLVLSIQETKALENVKHLVENEKREELRAILTPLQEIERAVLGTHQQHLSPVESITSIGVSDLNTLAQPLITLQEAVEKLQQTTFEGYSAFEILRERAEPVYEVLQYIEKLNVEPFEQAHDLSTQDDVSGLKTMALSAKESELKNASETRAQTEGPINLPIILNLIDDCLAKTNVSNELPEEGSAILTELTEKLDDLKELLACAGPDGSKDPEVNRTIAKALFKFREVLVHTYDDLADKKDLVDMLSDTLKTIEETLNEISQTIPNVEQLFADEIVANIRRDISELISSSKSVKKLDYLPYLDSMNQGLLSMESELVHLNAASADLLAKNSGPIIRMQVCLMDVFRAFNDIYEKADHGMFKPLLDGQNLLLSVNNFIEASEGEISKAELLQEIELLSKPFKEISELMQTGKFDEVFSDVKARNSEILEVTVRPAESREQEVVSEDVEASSNKELKAVEEEPDNLSTAIRVPVKDKEMIDRDKVDAEEKLKSMDSACSEVIEEKSNKVSVPSVNKIEPTESISASKTHEGMEITTARPDVDESELNKREQAIASGAAPEKETDKKDSIYTKESYLTEQEIPISSTSEDGVKATDSDRNELTLEREKELDSTVKTASPQDTLNKISNNLLEMTKEKTKEASAKKTFDEDTESNKLLGQETITEPLENQPQSYKETPSDEIKGSITEPIGNIRLESPNNVQHEEFALIDDAKSKQLTPLEDTIADVPNKADIKSEESLKEAKKVAIEALSVDKIALDVSESQENIVPLQGAESPVTPVTEKPSTEPVEKSTEEKTELEALTPDKSDRKKEESTKDTKKGSTETLYVEKFELETVIENVKLDVSKPEEDSLQLQIIESNLESSQSLLSVTPLEEKSSTESVEKSPEAERVPLENLKKLMPDKADIKSEERTKGEGNLSNEALGANKVELETVENVKLDVSKPQEDSVQLQSIESNLEPRQSSLSVAPVEEKSSIEPAERFPEAERVQPENLEKLTPDKVDIKSEESTKGEGDLSNEVLGANKVELETVIENVKRDVSKPQEDSVQMQSIESSSEPRQSSLSEEAERLESETLEKLTPDKADRKSEEKSKGVNNVTNEALIADKVDLETAIEIVKLDASKPEQSSVQLQGTESTLESKQSLLSLTPIEEKLSAESVEKSKAETIDLETLTPDKTDTKSEESLKGVEKTATEALSADRVELETAIGNAKLDILKPQEGSVQLPVTEKSLETEQSSLSVDLVENKSSDQFVEKSEAERVESKNLMLDKADQKSQENLEEVKKVADDDLKSELEMTLEVLPKSEGTLPSTGAAEQKSCDVNEKEDIAQASDILTVKSSDSEPLTNVESYTEMKTVKKEEDKQTSSGEECLQTDGMSATPEISFTGSDKDEMMSRKDNISNEITNDSDSETIKTEASAEAIVASEDLPQVRTTRKKGQEVEMLEAIFMKHEKEIIEHLDVVFTTLLQLVRNIQDTEVPLKLDKLPVAERSTILQSLSPILDSLLNIIEETNAEVVWSKIVNIRNLANDLDEASLIVLEEVAPQLYDLLRLLTKVDKAVVNDIINSLKKETSQQNVDEDLKSVGECFAQLQNLQDCSQEVTDCLRPIHQSIAKLKEALTALKENPQSDGDQSQAVSKSLFKLRECLVHTYDDLSQRTELADSLEQPLRDVEKMLEALISSTPDAKKLFAEEMIAKSLGEISKFVAIASTISQNESTKYWMDVITPFKNLEKSLRDLTDLSEEIMEKNSSHMIRLTTCLLEPFRALDDLRGNVPLKLREPIIETQNCLVTLSSFIESADGKIDRINLLQKIESLAPPMEKLVTVIAKIMTTPVLSDEEIAELIEPVEEAKLCLVEIQQKLTTGTEAECEQYLAEHGGNINLLKKQLEKIESEILSKHDLTDLVSAEIATLTDIVPLLTALQGTLGAANSNMPEESIEQQQGEKIEEATSHISEQQLNKTPESLSDDIKEATPIPDISKDQVSEVKINKSENIIEVIEQEEVQCDVHTKTQTFDRPEQIGTVVADLEKIPEMADQANLKAKEETGKEVIDAQNREELKQKITKTEPLEKLEENVEQLNIVATQRKSEAEIKGLNENRGMDKPREGESPEGCLIEIPEGTSPLNTHSEQKDLDKKEPIISTEKEQESPKESIGGETSTIVVKEEVDEKSVKSDKLKKEAKPAKGAASDTSHTLQADLDEDRITSEKPKKMHKVDETTKQALEESKSEKNEKTEPNEPHEKEKGKPETKSITSPAKLDELKDVTEVLVPGDASADDVMIKCQEEEKSSVTTMERKNHEDVNTLQEIKVMSAAIEDTMKTSIVVDICESSSVANVTDMQVNQPQTDRAQLMVSGKLECSSNTNDTPDDLLGQHDKQRIEEKEDASKIKTKIQTDLLTSTNLEVTTDKDQTEIMIPQAITQVKQDTQKMTENTDLPPQDQPQHIEVDGGQTKKDNKDKQDLPDERDIRVESESFPKETSTEKSSLESKDELDVTKQKREKAGMEKRKTQKEVKEKSEINTEQVEEKLIKTDGEKDDLASTIKSDVSVPSTDTDTPIISHKGEEESIPDYAPSKKAESKNTKFIENLKPLPDILSEAPAATAKAELDEGKHSHKDIENTMVPGEIFTSKSEGSTQISDSATGKEAMPMTEKTLLDENSEKSEQSTDQLLMADKANKEPSLPSHIASMKEEIRLDEKTDSLSTEIIEEISKPEPKVKLDNQQSTVILEKLRDDSFGDAIKAIESSEKLAPTVKTEEQATISEATLAKSTYTSEDKSIAEGSIEEDRETKTGETLLTPFDELAKIKSVDLPKSSSGKAGDSTQIRLREPIHNDELKTAVSGAQSGPKEFCVINEIDEVVTIRGQHKHEAVDKAAVEEPSSGKDESKSAPVEPTKIDAITKGKVTVIDKNETTDITQAKPTCPKEATQQKEESISSAPKSANNTTNAMLEVMHKVEKDNIETVEVKRPEAVTDAECKTTDKIAVEPVTPNQASLQKDDSSSSIEKVEKPVLESEKYHVKTLDPMRPDSSTIIKSKMDDGITAPADPVVSAEVIVEQDKSTGSMPSTDKQTADKIKQDNIKTVDEVQDKPLPENDLAKKGEKRKKKIKGKNDETKQGLLVEENIQPEILTASSMKVEDEKPEVPLTLEREESKTSTESNDVNVVVKKDDTTCNASLEETSKDKFSLADSKSVEEETLKAEELKEQQPLEKDSGDNLAQIKSKDLIEKSKEFIVVDQKPADVPLQSSNEKIEESKEEAAIILQANANETPTIMGSVPEKATEENQASEKSIDAEPASTIKDKSKEKSPSGKTRRSKKSPKIKSKDKKDTQVDDTNQSLGTERKKSDSEASEMKQIETEVETKVTSANELPTKVEIKADVQAKDVESTQNVEAKSEERSSGEANGTVAPNQFDKSQQPDQLQAKIGVEAEVDKTEIQPLKPKEKKRKKSQEPSIESKNNSNADPVIEKQTVEASTKMSTSSSPTKETECVASGKTNEDDKSGNHELLESNVKPLEKVEGETNLIPNAPVKDIVNVKEDKDDTTTHEKIQSQIEPESDLNKTDDEPTKIHKKHRKKSTDMKIDLENKPKVESANKTADLDAPSSVCGTKKSNDKVEKKNENKILDKESVAPNDIGEEQRVQLDSKTTEPREESSSIPAVAEAEEANNKQTKTQSVEKAKESQIVPEKTDENVTKRPSKSRKKSKDINATLKVKTSSTQKEEEMPSNDTEIEVKKPSGEKGKEGGELKSHRDIPDSPLKVDMVKVEDIQNQLPEEEKSCHTGDTKEKLSADLEEKKPLDSNQNLSKPKEADSIQSDIEGADVKKPKKGEPHSQASESAKKALKDGKGKDKKQPKAEIEASTKTEQAQTTDEHDEEMLKVSDDSTKKKCSLTNVENVNQDQQLSNSRVKDKSSSAAIVTDEESVGLAKTESEKPLLIQGNVSQSEKSQLGVKPKKAGRSQGAAFNVCLTSQTVSVGNVAKLVCNALGQNITAKWYRNGEEIIGSSQKYFSQNKDGLITLEIRDVEQSDAAEYRCVVTCNGDSAETNCQLSVFNPAELEVSEMKPIFTRCIRDSFQSGTNQLVLECKLSDGNKTRVQWYYGDKAIQANNKYKLLEQFDGTKQLFILNPDNSDNGVYSCCTVGVTHVEKTEKTINLADHFTPTRRKKLIRPKAIEVAVKESKQESTSEEREEIERDLILRKPLKHISVGEGRNVKLSFVMSGNPSSVTWLKDGEPLRRKQAVQATSTGEEISLELSDVNSGDSGEYTCLVLGQKNQISSSCNLRIFPESGDIRPRPFRSSLKEIHNLKRNELTLECEIHGRPIVDWYRNDKPISNNRYKKREEPGGVYKLVISNPVPSDVGVFTCRAETADEIGEIYIKTQQEGRKLEMNGHGKSCGTLSSQDARRKPIFSTPLRDRSVSDNSSIKLTCNIIGSEFDVHWMKNGKPLSKSSHYRSILDEGLASLEIFSTSPDDSGEYSCVACNEFGQNVSQCILKVYKGFEAISKPPQFTRSIKDTYYLNEDELVLDCRIRGNPRPEISWMKDTDMITNDSKYQQLDQADGYCKLIIREPTEKDSGTYTCRADNSAGHDKMAHVVDFKGRERFILEKAHGFFHRDPNKPHLTNILGDHIVTAGGTVAIQAEFGQTSSPIEVQWLKDKSALPTADNIRTFVDHGVYTLAIEKATAEVAGTYTCRASNAFGRLESNANVHIVAPVMKGGKPALFLSRPETEMKIAVHDPFSISFRVQGDPKPKLTLLKGTKDITKSDRVSKEAQEDYIRFTVHNSAISDSGTYFVVARNPHGTDRLFVTVTVKVPKK